jgi:hypothetical protein
MQKLRKNGLVIRKQLGKFSFITLRGKILVSISSDIYWFGSTNERTRHLRMKEPFDQPEGRMGEVRTGSRDRIVLAPISVQAVNLRAHGD